MDTKVAVDCDNNDELEVDVSTYLYFVYTLLKKLNCKISHRERRSFFNFTLGFG